MSATLQAQVRFLVEQGIPAELVREGELTGVLRVPYGGSPAEHPWRAELGLLWDRQRRRYLAWYALTPNGWSVNWISDVEFLAADVPDEEDPADHAMALVIRQIHRTRGIGTGPQCLFRVTSSRWISDDSSSRLVREALAAPGAAPDRGGITALRRSSARRRRGR
jgi:hypothetical protein